jgi:hypothetical protein
MVWERMRTLRSLLWISTFIPVLLAPWLCAPETHACSIAGCDGPAVLPASGEIPANELTLLYRGLQERDGGVGAPRLYKLVGDASVEVPLQLELRDTAPLGSRLFTVQPTESLKAGDQLLFEVAPSSFCSTQGLRTQFTLTEPRARPAALGTLAVAISRGLVSVTSGVSCARTADAAYADLTLTFAAEAQPFAQVVRLQLVLDGQPRWRFAASVASEARNELEPSARPRTLALGHDRVMVDCQTESLPEDPSSFVTSPGVHRASVRATFLDGSSLDTPEVEFELRCDGRVTDAGASFGADDAAAGSNVSTAPDSALPAAQSAPHAPAAADDGCSLAARRDRSAPPLGGLVLVSCGLLALRRRPKRVAAR